MSHLSVKSNKEDSLPVFSSLPLNQREIQKLATSCFLEIDLLAKSIENHENHSYDCEKENDEDLDSTDFGIPKKIHQTYKSIETLPVNWKETPESWKSSNPDFEYFFWSDLDAFSFIQTNFSWFLPIFNLYPHFIMKVDAFRPFLLWEHGGWYIDMDIQGKKGKSLSDLTKLTLLKKTQRENKDTSRSEKSKNIHTILLPDAYAYFMDESAPFEGGLVGSTKVTNCLIASRPRNPFLLLVIRLMCERALYGFAPWWQKKLRWWVFRKDFLILQSTGPGLWTEALKIFQKDKKIASKPRNKTKSKPKPKHGEKENKSNYSPISTGFLRSKTTWKDLSNSLQEALQRIQEWENGVLILSSYSVFPALGFLLFDRPFTLPSTYVTIQDGQSWMTSKFDKKMTKWTLQKIQWLQMLKSDNVFHQVSKELLEMLSSNECLLQHSLLNRNAAQRLLHFFPSVKKSLRFSPNNQPICLETKQKGKRNHPEQETKTEHESQITATQEKTTFNPKEEECQVKTCQNAKYQTLAISKLSRKETMQDKQALTDYLFLIGLGFVFIFLILFIFLIIQLCTFSFSRQKKKVRFKENLKIPRRETNTKQKNQREIKT